MVGSNFNTMSRETTCQPAASKALPTDLVPQKSSRSLGIFKEQDHRDCDDQEDSRVHVEVLWKPGNFPGRRAKRVGVCFASNTNLELWEKVEQGVIDPGCCPF